MRINKIQKLLLVIGMAFSIPFLVCGCGKNPETNPTEETTDNTSNYDDVLAQYKDMVQNHYYKNLIETDSYDSSFGKDIGFEIRTQEQKVFYALYDIDGNGTKELIIAAGEKDSLWNYDLYGFDGSKVVHIFPEMEFGYRTNFSLYEDGIIEVFYSSSAAESGVDFYRISNDGFSGELIDSFSMVGELDGEETVFTYYNKKNEITEEQYNTLIKNYEKPLTVELDWKEI